MLRDNEEEVCVCGGGAGGGGNPRKAQFQPPSCGIFVTPASKCSADLSQAAHRTNGQGALDLQNPDTPGERPWRS